MDYNFREIEKKWQQKWVEKKTYQVKEDAQKKKYYVLNIWLSGKKIHRGRFKALSGENRFQRAGHGTNRRI